MKRDSSEITSATTATTKSASPLKRAKLCVFDWLPDEVVLRILKAVPWELDTITQTVCRTWWAIIQERKHVYDRSNIFDYVVPSAKWALRNQAISLLPWLAINMKGLLNHNDARRAWMRIACHAGHIKTIAWLSSQEAPERIRSQPTSYQVELVAEYGDFPCYKMALAASERGGRVFPDDMYGACMGGHQETVEWIYDIYVHVQTSSCYAKPALHTCLHHASGRGHIELLGWLLAHGGNENWVGYHSDVPAMIEIAVVGGDHDVSVLNWMWAHADHKQTLASEMEAIESPRDFLIDLAHGKTFLPGLRWLQAHGVVEAEGYQCNLQASFVPWISRLCNRYELKVLRWLHEYKFVKGLERTRIWSNGFVDLDPYESDRSFDDSELLIQEEDDQETDVSSPNK